MLILLGEVTGDAHQQADRVLGDGVVIYAGSGCDEDSFIVTGFKVDGVKADSAASDDPQVRTVFDDTASVRLRSGDHRRHAFHFRDQVIFVPQVGFFGFES